MASDITSKWIDGYEGRYKIYNDGRVWSEVSMKFLKPIKGSYTSTGRYKNVMLSPGRKIVGIHRLVAEAFIENTDNKPQVNHIDGIPSNNNAENLEWCTVSENAIHAFNCGLRSDSNKSYNARKRARFTGTKNAELWSEFAEMYAYGVMKAREIGDIMGISRKAVNSRMIQYGVKYMEDVA